MARSTAGALVRQNSSANLNLVHHYERDGRWVVRELTDAALTAIRGDQDSIYVGGERGSLLISRDHGETWTTAASGTNACFRTVSGCGKEVFAVGSDGEFTHSRDAGVTWQADRTPGALPPRAETWPLYRAPDLTGVACNVNGSVTAIVYSGALLTSKDHGATWKRRDVQPEELHTARHPEGLAFVKLVRTPRELLVVSLIGVPAPGQKLPTRRWTNVLTLRGDRVDPWRLVEQLDNEVDTTLDQAPIGARSVVVTPSGRAVLVTDSGKYWAAALDRTWHYVFRLQQARAAAQPEQFDDVAGDDRKLYAVGSSGSLGISTDAGKTWRLLRTPEDHFRAVWTDGQNALVAGDYVTISRDAGKTWSALRRVLGKVQLAGRGASAAGTEYYVAGDRGLSYSSNAGETFAAVDVGLAPNFRATGVWGQGQEPVLVVGGMHERSSGIVRSAVVLRAAGSRSEAVLSLPWSEDEKESYAPAFTCIHGNRERRVYAGGRRGLFVRSLDGGANWQQMPPFANDEEELCGVHAGKGDTLLPHGFAALHPRVALGTLAPLSLGLTSIALGTVTLVAPSKALTSTRKQRLFCLPTSL